MPLSTIGVGKAFRDQDREARRARARGAQAAAERRQRNHDAKWTAGQQQKAACTSCGAEDHVGNLYTGAEGLVCPSCFSVGDGELKAEPMPSVLRLFARPLPFLLLFSWALLTQLPADPTPAVRYLVGALVLPYMALVAGSFLGMPWILLNLVAGARQDARRPDLERREQVQLVAGRVWFALVYVGCVTGFVGWALSG